MKDKKSLKVGDRIVDFGQVYRIFKIEKQKRAKGKEETVIFFRPYFKTKQNRTLICSIPVNNIKKTKIRRPISKKELRKLLKELSQKSDIEIPINITRAKEMLNLNDPHEIVRILKSLWLEKNDKSTSFTKTREKVLRLAIKRLVEEVALVNNMSIEKAKRQMEEALEKGTK